MSEEFFYHYTTMAGAQAIFLSGKLCPSLAVNGTAVHGDGVYLTMLDPRLGREQVGRNNWDGITRRQDQKMESYFEILLPSKKSEESQGEEKYPGAHWCPTSCIIQVVFEGLEWGPPSNPVLHGQLGREGSNATWLRNGKIHPVQQHCYPGEPPCV
eukprot:GFUD01078107.1.p2 GENE.GFUD01078107.1~~GFUD01078107.1.p2  ORF type:complete len:156 (-),score=23.60 GFUD01078107.1:220-687(-)